MADQVSEIDPTTLANLEQVFDLEFFHFLENQTPSNSTRTPLTSIATDSVSDTESTTPASLAQGFDPCDYFFPEYRPSYYSSLEQLFDLDCFSFPGNQKSNYSTRTTSVSHMTDSIRETETTTLASLVQSLPPELYNEIFDLTFAPAPGIQHIRKGYKPPSCLQVSRSTRRNYVVSHYTRSTFYMTKEDCAKWLASLPDNHIDLLTEIRILNCSIYTWSSHEGMEYVLRAIGRYCAQPVRYNAQILKFRAGKRLEGKGRWISVEDAFES